MPFHAFGAKGAGAMLLGQKRQKIFKFGCKGARPVLLCPNLNQTLKRVGARAFEGTLAPNIGRAHPMAAWC